MSTLTFGRFTVRIGLRPDNPAFPVYLVFVKGKLIGRSFSIPDSSACEWLERQNALDRVTYAETSAPPKTAPLRGVALPRRGRPKKASTQALEVEFT